MICIRVLSKVVRERERDRGFYSVSKVKVYWVIPKHKFTSLDNGLQRFYFFFLGLSFILVFTVV